VHDVQDHDDSHHVHFAVDDKAEDGASGVSQEGSASQMSLRNRQATGFVHKPPASTTSNVHFAESNEEVDAASSASQRGSASKANLRARQATGFVHDVQDHDDSHHVHFAVDDKAEDGASGVSQEGSASQMSLRNRQATGFVHKPPASTTSNVHFAESNEVVDAASEASQRGSASEPNLRARKATGFVHEPPASSASNVHFAEGNEVVAASEPTSVLEKARQHASTETLHPSLDKSFSERSIQPCSTRASSERSLRFAESTTMSTEASSDEDDVAPDQRDIRSRMKTPFISPERLGVSVDSLTDNKDDDDEDLRATQGQMSRSSSLTPRSSTHSSRKSSQRGSLSTVPSEDREAIKQVSLEIHAERQISHHVRLSMSRYKKHSDVDDQVKPAENGTNPEHDMERHLVSDAVKDSSLLMKTLKEIDFFEDLDDNSLNALIAAMSVYEFADGEMVLQQGDSDGSHFFVVAQGHFVVWRDGRHQADLYTGMSFGESVLLLYGQRSATVKADGVARCYAMEGSTVRNVLCDHYKEMHEAEVVQAAEDVMFAGESPVFGSLDGYQLQMLYESAKICNFKEGEDLFNEGTEPTGDMAHVVLSGSVTLKRKGQIVGRREPYSWLGAGSMECADSYLLTATAVGAVQTLVLHKGLLEDMFGDQLDCMLFKNRIRGLLALTKLSEMAGMDVELLDSLASTCQLVDLGPGEELNGKSLRFAVVLQGEVETRQQAAIESHKFWDSTCGFGEEHLLNSDRRWMIQARATDAEPAQLAVWRSQDLDRLAFFDNLSMEVEGKAKYLAQVYIFRTLPQEQLRRVALAIDPTYFKAGQRIMSKGDVAAEFYIIREGSIKIEIEGKHIRNQGVKDYFGERALTSSDSQLRTADVIAVEDCELWKMGKATFLEIMQGKILEYLTNRISLQDTSVSLKDLLFMRVIGRGGFGVVKMVCARRTQTRYALKCVRKEGIVREGQQSAIVMERNILAEVDHPFIIKYVRSFASATQLYFLMELVSGGELFDALRNLGILDTKQAQFYTGSLILALEYLHARRIAYLDLKAENCLIDHQGYIKLIDFGIAQRITRERCRDWKGTPHFMAPEIIKQRGCTTSADLWSLGICLFEFMTGDLPFAGRCTENHDIMQAVLREPLRFPDWLTAARIPGAEEAKSIMKGLLTRNPTLRLGSGFEGYQQLKEHAFFRDFSWDALLGRQLDPPFIPNQEVYAEDKEAEQVQPGQDQPDELLPLTEQEALESTPGQDWVDPNPGWDSDFN